MKVLSTFFYIVLSTAVVAGDEFVGTNAFDFTKLSHSARSEAVANALTAGKGLSAMSINPAALSYQNNVELYVQQFQGLGDTTFQSVFAALPTEWGTIGVDFGMAQLGTMERTTLSNRSDTGLSFSDSGYRVGIGYAKLMGNLGFGSKINYYQETLDNQKAQGAGLDLGISYKLNEHLHLGSSLTQITLKKIKYIDTEALLPTTFRLGLSYKTELMNNALLLGLDWASPQDSAGVWNTGAEYILNPFLTARMGYSTYSDQAQWTMGLGLNIEKISVDFMYKPSRDFGQSYLVSFGVGL